MQIVTITIEGHSAKVRSPFEAREIIKRMPSRRWSKAEKVWILPASDARVLGGMLKRAGYRVVMSGPQSRERQQSPPSTSNTWADHMFGALGPELATAAYKALSRVLHPDTGGSTEHMQTLNGARDRHLRS